MGRAAMRWRWILAGLAAVLGVALVLHLEAASRFDPKDLAPAPGPLVTDRQGRVLRLAPDAQGRKLVRLPEGPLPPTLVAAFLAAEDQRFWSHPGVDPLAVGRALMSNITAGRIVSGASTITQQLARLTYPGPRTYHRKLVEMVRSLRMEWALSKEEILRFYLDRVPQGNNLIGVETAARLYFGKGAAALSPGEAALLASLAKAPGTLNPYGPRRERLLARRDWVLSRMARLESWSDVELAAARAEPPALRQVRGRVPVFPFQAPHFVNLVLSQIPKGGGGQQTLKTSLDLNLQRRAEAIVASHQPRLVKSGATQAAAVILDNRTLEVLALVGSCGYGPRDQGFNNGAAAWRSPGSALKPFLYAQALDLGFTAATILEDVERRYRVPGGQFIPLNFDRFSHGPISLREALGNSLNLSAVYLLNQVEPGAYYGLLTRLGLINHPERGPEHYGLGLVVGNPEVSLLQLAVAYASLANGGLYRPPRLTLDQARPSGVRLFSPQAAYIIGDILADPGARSRAFGASQAMNPPYRLAIKTGTSTRYRDCWAAAYTPRYTLAVWVGNFNGKPTAKLSGAAAAAPILADLADELYRRALPEAPKPPEGVVTARICAFSGQLPGPHCDHQREELFESGAEPTETCTFHRRPQPWHRMPTMYAAWLHQRFERQAAGRFRLAGFDPDLHRTFQGTPAAVPAPDSVVHPGGRVTIGLAPSGSPGPNRTKERLLAISYPLPGDRFLMPPGSETLRLSLKAVAAEPLARVTWFVNGREAGAAGPPYEVTVHLGRGRHRLLAVGPDGRGDAVDIMVQ